MLTVLKVLFEKDKGAQKPGFALGSAQYLLCAAGTKNIGCCCYKLLIAFLLPLLIQFKEMGKSH